MSFPVFLIAVGSLMLTLSMNAQLEGTDGFDDGRKDSDKWDENFTTGRGSLAEAGGRLEFSTSARNGVHEAGWPWVYSTASYSEDWEFQCDVANAVEALPDEFASMGIYVASLDNERDLVFIEFYAAYFDEIGESVHGFSAGLENSRGVQLETDSFELPVTQGAVRIRYDQREKTLSLYYHSGETAQGYAWLRLAHIGIDGNGGNDANGNWRLNNRSEFDIGIYGYAANVSVSRGELVADNFTADGSQALEWPATHLYFEEVIGETVSIGWEAFESYAFEVFGSEDLKQWESVSDSIIGEGLYHVVVLPRVSPEKFFRVQTSSP